MAITIYQGTDAPLVRSEQDDIDLDSALASLARAYRNSKRAPKRAAAIVSAYAATRDIIHKDGANLDTVHTALKGVTTALALTSDKWVVDKLAVAYGRLLAVRDRHLGTPRTLSL